jgi:hypothetical protein
MRDYFQGWGLYVLKGGRPIGKEVSNQRREVYCMPQV